MLIAAAVALDAAAQDPARPNGRSVGSSVAGHEVVLLAAHCGVERWPVKTGSDADRYAVVRNHLIVTTVGSLGKLEKPSHYPNNHRIQSPPAERQIYQLHATVVLYREQSNGDLDLVLHENGHSMIAAIPDPSCVPSSSLWRPDIATSRATWTHAYPLSTAWHHISRQVTIRGLGFFEVPHGQTGAAPNAVELHPVIHIQLAKT